MKLQSVYKTSTGQGSAKEIQFELSLMKCEGCLMTTILMALGTGAVVGLIFSALKLPLPAPPVWAGIAGIVGIFLGGELWRVISEKFLG